MATYYRFTVKRLKLFKKMIDFSNWEDEIQCSKHLQKKQPNFCKIISDVKIDPRCLEAYKFCVLFCSNALEQAEMISDREFPPLSESIFRGMTTKVAQEFPSLGLRALKFPKRLKKHIFKEKFDDEDSLWLGLFISAFLITFEEYIYLDGIGCEDPEKVMSEMIDDF
jgi:hypothetical protein